MYEMAKKGREALKAKARRLAGEKDSKVDSSNWSAPEAMNADVKTGMRPISRRAYKTGGKVSGEAAPHRADRKPRKAGGEVNKFINRNVKEANEEREGKKHVGGMKAGGRAKKADGGVPLPPPRPKNLDDKQAKPTNVSTEVLNENADKDYLNRLSKSPGQGQPRKNGGKAEGGYVPHDTKAGKPTIPGMKKGGSAKNWISEAVEKPGALRKSLGVKEGQKIPAKKLEEASEKGGKMGKRARLAQTLKGMSEERAERKRGGRVGKTNINIVIATKPGGEAATTAPGMPRPPGGVPVPVPAPAPAPAAAPMPMPMPAPAGGPPPMARKRGGRVAKSYKDMTAGAGSGLGRLEKTEIQANKR